MFNKDVRVFFYIKKHKQHNILWVNSLTQTGTQRIAFFVTLLSEIG